MAQLGTGVSLGICQDALLRLPIKVPDAISDDEVAFTVLAAIGRLDLASVVTYIFC
jgi:hypothetical protein